MPKPRASRLTRPQGYWNPRPIPWRWAEDRLVQARNYWVASIRQDGRPHSRPVWGVWLDDAFWFDTGSLIGVNLMANPEVTVHLESGDDVVILEGRAERLMGHAEGQQFIGPYNKKYRSSQTEPPGALFRLAPKVALGWASDPTMLDGGAISGSTGTRWDFD